MVRAAVLLFCSHAYGDSSLMQTHSQSEHILDAFHTGSGRVKKMQENTQAMETQYKGLLQKIVQSQSLRDPATGEPYLPPTSFFEAVDTQFTSLLTELNEEKDANNKIIASQHTQLRAVNAAMQSAIAGLVAGESGHSGNLTRVRELRAAHTACRTQENTDIDAMEASCADFQNQNGGQSCSDNQDWYARYDAGTGGNDASVDPVDGMVDLSVVVEKAETCKNDLDTMTQQGRDCDTAQDTFSVAYCHYHNKLKDICDAYTGVGDVKGNYQTHVEELENTKTSVRSLEGEQKIIFRMVHRVLCFVNKLRQAEDNATNPTPVMPTQADIDECVGMDYTSAADGNLTIEYRDTTVSPPVAAVPIEVCWNANRGATVDASLWNPKLSAAGSGTASPNDLSSNNYQPGEQAWYDDEYNADMKSHGKLNGNAACNSAR